MNAPQPAAEAAPGETPPPRLMLSLEEAAHALGLAHKTLYNWISLDRLPFPTVKLGGRRMVRVAELQAFVDGLATTPAAPFFPSSPQQPLPNPALLPDYKEDSMSEIQKTVSVALEKQNASSLLGAIYRATCGDAVTPQLKIEQISPNAIRLPIIIPDRPTTHTLVLMNDGNWHIETSITV